MTAPLENCPSPSTANTCGLAAARYLTENNSIVLEPFENPSIIIGSESIFVLDVLQAKGRAINKGIRDVAQFTCEACSQTIQIVDDDGDLSAGIVSAES